MRKWNEWQEPLRKKFHALKESPFTDKTEEQRFLETELCLRLHERLQPQQSCLDVWTLLTGYIMPGINESPEARTMCALARYRARYLRTAPSWELWLKRYSELPDGLRLYHVDMETGRLTRRTFVGIVPERLDAYDAALSNTAPHAVRKDPTAIPGEEYSYTVENTEFRVRLPESFASSASKPCAVSTRHREPVEVTFGDLERAAEAMARADPGGNWIKRVGDLRMALAENHQLEFDTGHFTLDKTFHLVGLVSSGKSTWIQVLTYHLVTERSLHVSLVLNTVADSIEMAADFRRMGIAAAPVLGRDRVAHRLKYGQAHREALLPEDVFRSDDATRPGLRWMSAPCAISGLKGNGGPIPPGKEPCTGLRDHKGDYHTCPLFTCCPVHQAEQDLAEASVWITTPASFIYTRVPPSATGDDMRMLELIYRRSDVVFVDEADRAQAQFDQMYAPVNDLLGHPSALLDWIDPAMAQAFQRERGRLIRQPRRKYLKTLIGEARRFGDNALALLLVQKDLVTWISGRPLSLVSIIHLLAKDLACAPNEERDEGVMETLLVDLRQFADHPTTPLKEFDLASLVDSVHHEDDGPMGPQLEAWLNERVPWEVSTHPKKDLLLLKLEVSLWLIAMNKRVYDLVQTWMHTSPNLEDRLLLDQSPPHEYEDIVPESPFGNLIGYQFVERGKENGVLQYLQCRGIGRWVLLHFDRLYLDTDGVSGPHVVLAAATSWAPGSPQFHIHKEVNAILFPPSKEQKAIEQSRFEFLPVPGLDGRNIRVSGTYGEDGQDLFANLEKLTRYLATERPNGPSLIERELTYWRERGPRRLVALIVGSYAQARHIKHVLQTIPSMRGRSINMLPDTEGDLEAGLQAAFETGIIHRGEVERLRERAWADVLIVPALAFQRGYNVLDDLGGALLGSAFFLVRPYPHPDDASLPIIGVNDYTIDLLNKHGWMLPPSFGTTSKEMIGELRRRTFLQWMQRLAAPKNEFGLQGLDKDLYRQFLWDQLVLVDQIFGRFVRGGRAARGFFVDGSFHPERGRSMLRGWIEIIGEYLAPQSTKPLFERQLAEALYGPFYRALTQMELS